MNVDEHREGERIESSGADRSRKCATRQGRREIPQFLVGCTLTCYQRGDRWPQQVKDEDANTHQAEFDRHRQVLVIQDIDGT